MLERLTYGFYGKILGMNVKLSDEFELRYQIASLVILETRNYDVEFKNCQFYDIEIQLFTTLLGKYLET